MGKRGSLFVPTVGEEESEFYIKQRQFKVFQFHE
jgi:hypothetical protein